MKSKLDSSAHKKPSSKDSRQSSATSEQHNRHAAFILFFIKNAPVSWYKNVPQVIHSKRKQTRALGKCLQHCNTVYGSKRREHCR